MTITLAPGTASRIRQSVSVTDVSTAFGEPCSCDSLFGLHVGNGFKQAMICDLKPASLPPIDTSTTSTGPPFA